MVPLAPLRLLQLAYWLSFILGTFDPRWTFRGYSQRSTQHSLFTIRKLYSTSLTWTSFFGLPAQQTLSHQHLTSKESFAQYSWSSPSLPLPPSLLMCFSSYCTEVAEVLFIMSLANSLASEREGERLRGSCGCQDMKTVSIPFSARTCHCPPLTCPIELACNGQKKKETKRKLHVIIKENAWLNFPLIFISSFFTGFFEQKKRIALCLPRILE